MVPGATAINHPANVNCSESVYIAATRATVERLFVLVSACATLQLVKANASDYGYRGGITGELTLADALSGAAQTTLTTAKAATARRIRRADKNMTGSNEGDEGLNGYG